MRKIIIEFIAVSGSGKTYISEQLIRYLKLEPLSGNTVIYSASDIWRAMNCTRSKGLNKGLRIFSRVRCIFSLAVIKILFILIKSGTGLSTVMRKIEYYLSILNLYRITNKIIQQNKHCNAVFILDEGIFHASEIFMDDTANHNYYEFLRDYEKAVNNIKYLQYQNFKKAFIFVESEIESNYNRLDRRPEGWPILLRYFSKEERTEAMALFQSKVSAIRRYISANGFPYYVIENCIDYAATADSFTSVFYAVRQTVINELNQVNLEENRMFL